MATLTRQERLAGYLAQAQRTAFVWGRHDCLMWLANWVFLIRDIDPAAGLRGTYDDEAGAARLVKRYGGAAWLVGHCCRQAGMVECGPPGPVAGDIGVVPALTLQGVEWVGAICTGRRWAMLTAKGLMSWPADPAAAWSV